MKIEVVRYQNRSGYVTRHWAVYLNGDLLTVTLYRKGALAVAAALMNLNGVNHVLTSGGEQGKPSQATMPLTDT